MAQRSSAVTSALSRPIVLADPDFGPAAAPGGGWQRLPASAKEGETIGKLLQVQPYEQAAATTAVLTSAKGPALVHVASHGYYAKAADRPPAATARPAAAAAAGLRSAIAGPPASRDDAMLNSGIVLAGANRSLRPDQAPAVPAGGSPDRSDDGYLTAKEAAQLQLLGTELVVLSACDSASGEQASGEGLLGSPPLARFQRGTRNNDKAGGFRVYFRAGWTCSTCSSALRARRWSSSVIFPRRMGR